MTDETMNLQALLEKTTDGDFLREMISFTAQRLMELEVETLTGAALGARTPDRALPQHESRSWLRLCARAPDGRQWHCLPVVPYVRNRLQYLCAARLRSWDCA